MAKKKKAAKKKAPAKKKPTAKKKTPAAKKKAPAAAKKKPAAKKKKAPAKKRPATRTLPKPTNQERLVGFLEEVHRDVAPTPAVAEPAPGPTPTPAASAVPIEARNRLAAAMARNPGALADLCPELNEESGKWENNLNDEKGNCLDVVEYDTEAEAEREIDEYCAHLDAQHEAGGSVDAVAGELG